MAELVLTNMHETLLHELQERAALHKRTPAQEAATILAEVLRANGHDVWPEVDAIYSRLAASGRSFSDSADLLREDRDR